MITRKSPSEIEKMRKSGLLVYQILQELAKRVEAGVTTQDLEVLAEKMIRDAGRNPRLRDTMSRPPGHGIRLCCVLR